MGGGWRGAGLALLLLAEPAGAETAPAAPTWANLAECSAVFSAVAEVDGDARADQAELAQAYRVAQLFLDHAVASAADAGQTDPAADVASIMGYLTERWQNRIEGLLSTPSNLDWIAYCGNLGREEGILPLQP